VHRLNAEKISPAQLKETESAMCSRNGWKLLVSQHPIDKSVERVVKKCGVQLFISGSEHHQEHITGQDFEIIMQGAGSKLRGVDQKQFKPGDLYKQRFARSEMGFALIEATSDLIDVRFYNESAHEIYQWSANPNQIGLPKPVKKKLFN
jgi:hypothetical protein